MFSEVDSEDTLGYVFPGANTDITSWATIDNSTHKVYGTPPQFSWNTTTTFDLFAKDIALNTSISVTANLNRNSYPIRETSIPDLV